MSSEDNTSSWSLDLDTEDAKAGIETLQAGLNKVGITKFDELGEAITSIGTAAGIVGLAVLALRETFMLVFDAEQINAVNQQFDVLARNAGLYGDKLKEALEVSSGGLVGETELLQGAAGAIAKLGQNAARLPEIMNLARQATAVFGGDLMQNFDGISQAIASGNSRMLKHMGIIIDQKKAYEDYAKSIGVAADELSEAGKQHAMFNAVLEKGATAFQGVDLNIKQATNTWLQFKAAMAAVGETTALAFNQIFGENVRRVLTGTKEAALNLGAALKSVFGTELEQHSAKVRLVSNDINRWEQELRGLQLLMATDTPFKSVGQAQILNGQIDDYKKKIAEAKQQVAALQKTEETGSTRQIAAIKSVTKESEVNLEKRKQDILKFQTDVDHLRAENDAAAKKSATSVTQVEQWAAAEKVSIEVEANDKITKLRATPGLDPQLRADKEVEIERAKNAKLLAVDMQLEADRLHALDNLAAANGSAGQKFANVWVSESTKASREANNFAKIAEKSFAAVKDNSISAFEAMGSGAQSAGDAMKGFLFNSLGDIAEAQGKVMLLSFLVNPAEAVAGAALIALGSWLKGQAGGSGGSSSGSAPSGDSGSATGGTTPTDNSQTQASSVGPATETQAPKAGVTIQIQGHLFQNDQTRNWLVDQIRAAGDISDYKIQSIGGGL